MSASCTAATTVRHSGDRMSASRVANKSAAISSLLYAKDTSIQIEMVAVQ